MEAEKSYSGHSGVVSTIDTPRQQWVPVRNLQPYLYHITRKGSDHTAQDRLIFRLGYAVEGIRGREWGNEGVWVNRRIDKLYCLWPVAIDTWQVEGRRACLDLLLQYDIWRIDTSLIDNQWFLDPNMMHAPNGHYREIDYLFTENSVHPRALRLYQFYIDEKAYLQSDTREPRYSLVPVQEVNDFIRYKWGRHKNGRRG